jgi:hypothetical protein
MRFHVLPLSLAALGLSACNSGEEPVPEETAATPTPTPLPTEVPAAYQGRWGLTAEDCTSDRGDAKGLLEVNGTELRFYESVGTLEEVTGATAGRFRGNFAFTGEGMEWQRDFVLDLRDDGQVLVRREFGEDASADAFDYMRCP